MARPIEPTPILRGEDARRFYLSLANAKYSPEKAEMLKRADEAYKHFRRNFNTKRTFENGEGI